MISKEFAIAEYLALLETDLDKGLKLGIRSFTSDLPEIQKDPRFEAMIVHYQDGGWKVNVVNKSSSGFTIEFK